MIDELCPIHARLFCLCYTQTKGNCFPLSGVRVVNSQHHLYYSLFSYSKQVAGTCELPLERVVF